jgi:uncharacterized protein YoxC
MGIDELSQTLGRLEAGQEQVAQQCRSLFVKYDEGTAQLHSLAATVENLGESLVDLRKAVAQLAQETGELRRLRDRGMGMLSAMTLLGGGAGVGAAKLLGLFSGGH